MTTMHTYHMTLDGGQGGDDAVEAASLAEALTQALAWAAEGDWSATQEDTEEAYGGCGTVLVRVWREDENGEILEEDTAEYTIPTLGDLQESELEEDGEVLAERTGEFSTERIVRIGEELYYQHPNGGDRGAWDRQDGDGVWRDRPVEPTRMLSVQEARSMLLDWGYEPAEVARMTQ